MVVGTPPPVVNGLAPIDDMSASASDEDADEEEDDEDVLQRCWLLAVCCPSTRRLATIRDEKPIPPPPVPDEPAAPREGATAAPVSEPAEWSVCGAVEGAVTTCWWRGELVAAAAEF